MAVFERASSVSEREEHPEELLRGYLAVSIGVKDGERIPELAAAGGRTKGIEPNRTELLEADAAIAIAIDFRDHGGELLLCRGFRAQTPEKDLEPCFVIFPSPSRSKTPNRSTMAEEYGDQGSWRRRTDLEVVGSEEEDVVSVHLDDGELLQRFFFNFDLDFLEKKVPMLISLMGV